MRPTSSNKRSRSKLNFGAAWDQFTAEERTNIIATLQQLHPQVHDLPKVRNLHMATLALLKLTDVFDWLWEIHLLRYNDIVNQRTYDYCQRMLRVMNAWENSPHDP